MHVTSRILTQNMRCLVTAAAAILCLRVCTRWTPKIITVTRSVWTNSTVTLSLDCLSVFNGSRGHVVRMCGVCTLRGMWNAKSIDILLVANIRSATSNNSSSSTSRYNDRSVFLVLLFQNLKRCLSRRNICKIIIVKCVMTREWVGGWSESA